MARRARRDVDGPTLTVLSDDGRWEAVFDGAVVTWGPERHAVLAEAQQYAERVGADVVVIDAADEETGKRRRLAPTCYGV